MRITIVNQFYAPDLAPTAQLAASLADHRVARGDEVTVVAGRGRYVEGASGPGDRGVDGVRVHRMRTPGFGRSTKIGRVLDYAAFYVGATARLVAGRRQDVIVSMTTPPYIGFVARLHRLRHRHVRVVVWHMDAYPDVMEHTGVIRRGGLVSRALRQATRSLLGGADHVVALDRAMADLLADAAGDTPVSVVPNWERRTDFPNPVDRAEPVRSLDVLYLGNAGYGHDFATVLEAAARLEHDTAEDDGEPAAPVRFRFVGGGSRWSEIAAAAETRGLQAVTLAPYVDKDEVPALLAEADLALITLRDDALGVMSPSKLHASLGAGVPICYVGPAGSNVDDAITRFDCGISIRHGDVDGLVTAIRALRDDPARRAALRQRAREAFEAAYCDEVCLPLLDEVIDG